MISVILSFLRSVLRHKIWSNLMNVPWAMENNVYSDIVVWNAL